MQQERTCQTCQHLEALIGSPAGEPLREPCCLGKINGGVRELIAMHPDPVIEEQTSDRVIVIKHTSTYRGDHSADLNVAYTFSRDATLNEVLAQTVCVEDDWLEIPIQGEPAV